MTAARFFGGLLMAFGVMIGGLSGLCTVVGLAFSLGSPGDVSMLPLVALFGAPPIAVGIGLFFLGRYLWRQGVPPAPKPVTASEDPPAP